MDEQFDDIRPFNDDEIPAAVASLSKEEYFRKAIGYLPGDTETFMKEFSTVSTTDEFQTRMLFPFLKWIAATTSDSLRGVGFENLDPSKSYTYISNHRDILLDATLLGLLLAEHGIPTPETALGDNLLVYPWMSELVRVNKSIIVYRNMPMMKTLEEAHRLSGYINHALRDKNRSVWIAQREGRAKNSDDRTQESVIKMLAFEGEGDIRHNVEALHIVPVSISYEYDPCDYLKAREFQLKRDNPEFKKSPKDDLNSMSTGLLGKKGNIRFTISGSISDEAAKLPCHLKRAEYFTAVAGIMDRRIHQGYCMFSGNYVSYDLLTGTEQFAGKYTEAEKQKFQDYLEGQLSKIDNLPNPDYKYLRTKILEMYANPLRNKMAVSDMP